MKKILPVLLCICVFFNMIQVSFAYNSDNAMQVLKGMGIVHGDPDGNLRPDDPVKRSEFAKMAVLLSEHKTKVALNSKISVFTDCPASHWASPYVKTAAENGIISGYSNGLFGPDDYITYSQAVTIALRLLGYTDEDFGFSYPEGQLGMALSLKLNSGISKLPDDNLTRADVSVILTNMLLTHKKGTDSDYITSIGYSIKKDTVLVATNNESAAVAQGKIYTSNGEFTIDENFDKSLVGKKGSALIDSEGNLVTLIEDGYTVSKTVVYSAGTELVTIYNDKGLTELKPDGGTLCYNGIQKTTFSALCSSLATGDILTIASNSDGNIDYIITVTSDFDGPYTVKTDGEVPLSGNYSDYYVVKNGSKSSLDNIKQNDIVYVSDALAGIFVYSKKVSGIYSKAIPNIDSPKSVVVGGKEYAIESLAAFSKLSSGGGKLIGDTVILLIGRDGGVADISDTTDTSIPSADEIKQTDTNITKAPEALLCALGALTLVNNEIPNGETPVTRAEFTKMAVMISNYRNLVSTGSKLSLFPDCTSSYWATPYIKTAVENGIMSAYNDSYFRPETPITYAEAADACLKVLGYTKSDFSDWPSSQLSVAASKGISKNLSKSADDNLTKGEAAVMLYNTLCATGKNGVTKGITSLGYNYYEEATLIATNKENSSVPSGKLLTSVGTFSVDEQSFDHSDIGKTGQLLIYSDKVQMFNKNECQYTRSTVYSVIPGGLALAQKSGIFNLAVADDTPVFIDAGKTTFSTAKASVATGDSALVIYDSNGRIEYIHISTSSLAGPYIVDSPNNWFTKITGAGASSKIMKNGYVISSSALTQNDILYYSPSLDTAFAYNERVIGILEDASPSKDAPNTVRVSGVSYPVESASVSFAESEYGDTVVLCLGRTGSVAVGYSASGTEVAGFLVGTGIKTFTNHNGESYTSYYASLVLADGSKVDFATDYEYDGWINKIMSAKFSDGKAKLSLVTAPGTISGKVDAANLKIGSSTLSSNVKIIDVGYIESNQPAAYKVVYPQRIDGLNLFGDDVLYAKAENGFVTEIILNNVTGDAISYGVITSARSSIGGMNASGSYTCDIGGSSYTYNGGVYTNLKKGSIVSAVVSGGKIVSFKKLTPQSVNIEKVDYTSVTTTDGKNLTLADNVFVYKLTGSYDYTYIPFSEFVQSAGSYSTVSAYADKSEAGGGRVRIITVR